MRNLRYEMVMSWLIFSGCAVTASSRSTVEGSYISDETLSQVEIGQTTKSWLIEKLGPPTSIEARGEGMEDIRYESTESIKEHATVIFIFSFSNSEERTEAVIFEMKDDLVQRYYRRSIARLEDSEID